MKEKKMMWIRYAICFGVVAAGLGCRIFCRHAVGRQTDATYRSSKCDIAFRLGVLPFAGGAFACAGVLH